MSPPPPEEGFDLATAYHEAGHAVIALAYDRPIHRVSVLPSQLYAGLCEFQKGKTRGSVDIVEREILISLAGMVAEARHTGSYNRAAAGRDLKQARAWALQRADERQLERYERRMLAKVESLFHDEQMWNAVERIAAELMRHGRISGRAARHLYDEAMKE